MSLSKKLVGMVGAGLLGLGMLSGNSAKACDDYWEPATCYRQVSVTGSYTMKCLTRFALLPTTTAATHTMCTALPTEPCRTRSASW